MDGWTRRFGALGLCTAALVACIAPVRAQTNTGDTPTATGQRPGTTTTSASVAPDENLTVRGKQTHHFETAPMPGAPMPPPPDKPGMHLGRYKISGDQSKRDGYDDQTGAYIAPFGNAYTGASPVAGGLASQHGP